MHQEHRIKWMFITATASAKMGRAYPDSAATTRDAQPLQ